MLFSLPDGRVCFIKEVGIDGTVALGNYLLVIDYETVHWKTKIGWMQPDFSDWNHYFYKFGAVGEVQYGYDSKRNLSRSTPCARDDVRLMNTVDTKALLEEESKVSEERDGAMQARI